ncbi:MAG: hypothetical protein ACK56I_28795, partial [bacterium]
METPAAQCPGGGPLAGAGTGNSRTAGSPGGQRHARSIPRLRLGSRAGWRGGGRGRGGGGDGRGWKGEHAEFLKALPHREQNIGGDPAGVEGVRD